MASKWIEIFPDASSFCKEYPDDAEVWLSGLSEKTKTNSENRIMKNIVPEFWFVSSL